MKDLLKESWGAFCEGFWYALKMSQVIIKTSTKVIWDHLKRVSNWQEVFIAGLFAVTGYSCVFPDGPFGHNFQESVWDFKWGFTCLVFGVISLVHYLGFPPKRAG